MERDETRAEQLLRCFFPDGNFCVINKQGMGMNNTTRFVEAEGERYVLRIYETHREEDKVEYEHAVLLALAGLGLPFHTPVPIRTRAGDTRVRLDDGKLAALFTYAEGVNPSLQSVEQLYAFGQRAAQLSSALASVRLDKKPVYRPYYELENTHPRCSMEEVRRFCTDPPEPLASAGHIPALKEIARQLDAFARTLPRLQKLPHQLIHGDLNASNVLMDPNGGISAVLDFEFVTRDLRVMEAAVCLSDLIRPGQEEEILWERIEAFLAGYGSCGRLEKEELQALPLLLQLRRLDVFLHFLGRYWDGVDGIRVVEDQILRTSSAGRWLDEHEEKLVTLLKGKSVNQRP